MSKNSNLHKAKDTKNDEFYTRLEDIEAEISQHEDYVKHFKDKVVLCNCDDPESSNFFVFFKLHFKQLQLKKLITTHFKPDGEPSYKLEWCGEMLNDDMVNLVKTPLKENGDFRSEECIEILKEADIVVTNPPFSLFRSYVSQLMEYKKKFIIIGSQNAITYKEFFPLLKENKVWIGYNSVKEFKQPDGTFKKFGNICWYTNLDIDKLHEEIPLTKNYKGNEKNYPKYDNYDAIECSKVKEIPKDYVPCWFNCKMAESCPYAISKGIENNALCEKMQSANMAVPITYMDKHNSDQFEIIDANTIRENSFIKEKPHGLIKDKEAIITSCSQIVNVERERERERCQNNICSNCHQTQEDVMELLESQLPSSISSVLRSSKLLDTNMIYSEMVELVSLKENSELIQLESIREYLLEKRKCNGIMGVPITFLDKYCFEQFKIIGMESSAGYNANIVGIPLLKEGDARPAINGKTTYARILIKRKENVNDSKNI